MATPGRPPHLPTDERRREVEAMASYGVPLTEIAQVLRISDSTLRRFYQYELCTGHVRANSKVAQSLFEKACGNGTGSVTAAIFWLKCRAGWVEPQPGAGPGKKELQQKVAQTAGSGTEWAEDLEFENRAN